MITPWNDGYANYPDVITIYYMYQNVTMYPINTYNFYILTLKINSFLLQRNWFQVPDCLLCIFPSYGFWPLFFIVLSLFDNTDDIYLIFWIGFILNMNECLNNFIFLLSGICILDVVYYFPSFIFIFFTNVKLILLHGSTNIQLSKTSFEILIFNIPVMAIIWHFLCKLWGNIIQFLKTYLYS